MILFYWASSALSPIVHDSDYSNNKAMLSSLEILKSLYVEQPSIPVGSYFIFKVISY